MKKVLITLMIFIIFFSNFSLVNTKAAEINPNDKIMMNIPQEVLDNVPEEIKSILVGKEITKKQYDLYLELVEKESNPVLPNTTGEFTTLASSVNPKNCTYDLGSSYCFRIDPANSSTKEPYHIH